MKIKLKYKKIRRNKRESANTFRDDNKKAYKDTERRDD